MNYTTSKDYEKLWNLVQEGKKIPCLYQSDGIQRAGIAQKVCGEPAPPDGAFCGVGLVDSTKDIFIMYCTKMHVEMLLSDEWIKIESNKNKPIEGKKYLVRCKYGTETGIFNNGVFRSQITDVTLSGITHWKPLPKAPEVQS